MSQSDDRRPLPHSQPGHHHGGVAKRKADHEERLRITVVLRPVELTEDDDLTARVASLETALPHERAQFTEEELRRLHAADEAHIAKVVSYAQAHGLDVLDVSRVDHDVILEGTVGAMNRAFGVELEHFEHGRRSYRTHAGPIHLPEDLHSIVFAVLGLDSTPLSRFGGLGDRRNPPYAPRRIGELYRFPAAATGKGQRIAILCFGGGFHSSDLSAYFSALGISAPVVHTASVLGVRNDPLEMDLLRSFVLDAGAPEATLEDLSQKYGPVLEQAIMTLEATMDVQIAGAIAPDAEIDVYFTSNDDQGLYSAVNAALGLHHEIEGSFEHSNGHQLPSAISISWGNSEAVWSSKMRAMNLALDKARHRGVTVCCASGDFGSWTLPSEKLPASVSFPASSPYVLAVGGTTLNASVDSGEQEVVWNNCFLGSRVATGGGISGYFELPSYQREAGVPRAQGMSRPVWMSPEVTDADFSGRGVPDVAGSADSEHGYRIFVGGEETAGGGTSASAPLWAALLALIGEELGHPVGWLNPLIYSPRFRQAFRCIESGDNDISDGRVAFFEAGAGWNACTGLGSPIGEALLAALKG